MTEGPTGKKPPAGGEARQKENGKEAARSKPAEGTLKEGIRLFHLKRWDLALKELLLVKSGAAGGTTGDKANAEEQIELAYFLGLCYTKLGRYDDALLYLEQVVTAGQDVMRTYQCRMALAYIYVITKRSKMAEFELKRLQRGGFESAQLYNTLAYAAWSQERYKNAVEFYEKALDIDEDNATAMNSMGFILADADIDIMRGLRLCRKAVDQNPQSPAYLDSLGWAYFKSGELVEARTWLRRALDMAPNEQAIREHLKIVTGEAE
jgi:tetratricopeptide (TPR) repeat protein